MKFRNFWIGLTALSSAAAFSKDAKVDPVVAVGIKVQPEARVIRQDTDLDPVSTVSLRVKDGGAGASESVRDDGRRLRIKLRPTIAGGDDPHGR